MRLWKKVLAAATAGVLCLGSAGVTGLQNTLESVGTVLSVSAEGTDETERVPVSTGTTTVRVGTGTTQLEYQAFDDDTVEITDCDNEAAGELEIPAEIDGKSVTSIGDIAFYDHENLTSVIIPVGVTTIKWAAFSLCSNLKSVVMPDGMKIIGSSAFEGCSNLTDVTIPNSVIKVRGYAFASCTSLTNITIPDKVTTIRK